MAGITKPEFMRNEREIVVRNRTRGLSALIGSTVFATVITLTGIVYEIRRLPPLDSYMGGPISAVMFYTGWLVARRTSVRLRIDEIVIENVFIRYMIPWRQGRQFYVADGIRLRLLDGRSYALWVFQGSLASKLDGYSAFHPIVDQLNAEGDRIVADNFPEYPPPPTRWRLQMPDWWVPIIVIGVVDGVIGLVALAR